MLYTYIWSWIDHNGLLLIVVFNKKIKLVKQPVRDMTQLEDKVKRIEQVAFEKDKFKIFKKHT